MSRTITRRGDVRAERDRGFTLVEILIAIVLVGILSAVVVVGIGRLADQGSAGACTSSLDAARAGATVYFTGNLSYPTTFTQLTTGAAPALTLPSGVTVNSAGDTASGSGWTMTMTSGDAGTPPVFTCVVAGAVVTSTRSAVPVSSGLVAWYDAADAASISRAGIGVVSAWSDKSGKANHLATSAGAPLYLPASRSGLGVVHFDGSAALAAPNSPTLSPTGKGLTIVMSYRADAVGSGWAIVNKENSWEFGESGGGGTTTAAVQAGCWAWVGGTNSARSSWHTNGFRYTPTWLFSTDGGAVTTGSSPCSGNIVASTQALTVGGRSAGTWPLLTGDIGEVLIYDRALTDAEYDLVRAYLQAKWGTP